MQVPSRKRQLLPRTNGCKNYCIAVGWLERGLFKEKTILLISGPAKFRPDSHFLKSVEMSELLWACTTDSDKLCVSPTRSFQMMHRESSWKKTRKLIRARKMFLINAGGGRESCSFLVFIGFVSVGDTGLAESSGLMVNVTIHEPFKASRVSWGVCYQKHAEK